MMANSADFREDIQGLRAVAVIAVIVFHFDAALLPGGFVGVDVFFVISGYLITRILLQRKSAVGHRLFKDLRDFYGSRLKRIAPAYFVMLCVVGFCAGAFLTESDFGGFRNSLNSALYFASNNFFAGFGDYFAPATHEQPLLHTWSLAVEMQFYLLFPLAALFFSSMWLRILIPIAFVGLVTISERTLRVEDAQQVTYYALYARAPEFLSGAMVALFNIGRAWTGLQANVVAGFGLLLIVLSFALPGGPFPGVLALPPVLGASLVIASGNASILRYLRIPLLVWVGALSYSLYLWHWPVLAFIRYFTGEQRLDAGWGLLFCVATLSLASASYYWVEKRFHGVQISYSEIKRWRGVVVLFMIGVSSAPLASALNKRLSPPSLAVEYRRYSDPATICHGQIVGDCLRGDLSSEREVLVLGDSHAAMLNLFFESAGRTNGFKARIVTASSCVTIPGFDVLRLPDWARQPCRDQIDVARKYLENASVIFIAGMWTYQTESEEFVRGLKRFLTETDSRGAAVFLLPQIPQLAQNPLRARRFQHIGLPERLRPSPASGLANELIGRIAQGHSHVRVLDLGVGNLFSRAPYFRNDLIYFDRDHINEVGSRLYAERAQDRLRAAIKMLH